MRIIRIRRGFTTNSSSASEWLTPTPTGSSTAAKTPHPIPTLLPQGEEIVVRPMALVSTTPAPLPQQSTLEGHWTNSVTNGVLLAGLAVVVGASMAAEKLVSKLRGRKRKSK